MQFDLDRAKRMLPLSKLCAAAALPQTRKPRLIAGQAFAPTLETSFSGSTFYLALAGLATGTLEGCFSLYSGEAPLRSLQLRGLLWKTGKVLRRQRSSGFKFSGVYADAVWPRYMEALGGTTLLSNFQVCGHEFLKRRKALDITTCFYIDGTLCDYFESYGGFEVDSIDASTRNEAIALEREGYAQAERIVAMSRMTAQSLQHRYQVPADKISVIVPGANLPDDAVDAAVLPPVPDRTREFVLGFVGLYPLRKGLARLAAAVKMLRERGLPIRLRVIGNCSDDVAKMDGVDFLGRINKTTELERFLAAIAGVHLGCMVSQSELAGIAYLEFLRLGVPVLGARVGGAIDILEGAGCVAVEPDISVEELAEVLAELYRNSERYQALKQEAENRSRWASWRRVAQEMDRILP